MIFVIAALTALLLAGTGEGCASDPPPEDMLGNCDQLCQNTRIGDKFYTPWMHCRSETYKYRSGDAKCHRWNCVLQENKIFDCCNSYSYQSPYVFQAENITREWAVSFEQGQGEAGATSSYDSHRPKSGYRFLPAMAFKRQIFKSFYNESERTYPWANRDWFPQTVYFRLSAALVVSKFSFRSRAEDSTRYPFLKSLIACSPTEFDFVGSDDCKTWKTIMEVRGVEWSTFDQEQKWTIPEEAQRKFLCFGITILKNGGHKLGAIQDLKMWYSLGKMCDLGWESRKGLSCELYQAYKWCQYNGDYGTGWNKQKFGTFQKYLDTQGRSALVCPQCGCGIKHQSTSSNWFWAGSPCRFHEYRGRRTWGHQQK